MKRTSIIPIPYVLSVVMLSSGIGILIIPPMVFEALTSYSSDFEIILEKAANSPLISSTLPILSTVLLILGLIVLGVHCVVKR
jgi:hypothetical protein